MIVEVVYMMLCTTHTDQFRSAYFGNGCTQIDQSKLNCTRCKSASVYKVYQNGVFYFSTTQLVSRIVFWSLSLSCKYISLEHKATDILDLTVILRIAQTTFPCNFSLVCTLHVRYIFPTVFMRENYKLHYVWVTAYDEGMLGCCCIWDIIV